MNKEKMGSEIESRKCIFKDWKHRVENKKEFFLGTTHNAQQTITREKNKANRHKKKNKRVDKIGTLDEGWRCKWCKKEWVWKNYKMWEEIKEEQ